MDHEFRAGRLHLRRTPEERAPIVARLARIEGQVRGIRQMVEDDRYCGDEVQQSNAVTSAMREVAVMIIAQHVEEGLRYAVAHPDEKEAVAEMLGLLRAAMKMT